MQSSRESTFPSCLAVVAVAAAVAGPVQPARASDIEVFFDQRAPAGSKPNVLVIVDTSQSMYIPALDVPREPYDPAISYQGPCTADRESPTFYWTSEDGDLPRCGEPGRAGLAAAQFDCPAWKARTRDVGYHTRSGRVAQRDGDAWVGATVHPAQRALTTTCEGDTTQSDAIDWTATAHGTDVYPRRSLTFYDGNWLNWVAQDGGMKPRIDLVREAIARAVAGAEGIKVGLMRYGYDGTRRFEPDPTGRACVNDPDVNGDGSIDVGDEAATTSGGAPVIFPVTDLDAEPLPGLPGATVRDQLRYRLGVDAANASLGWTVDPTLPDSMQPFAVVRGTEGTCPVPLMVPGGRSPVAGALLEAHRYFSNQEWSQEYGRHGDLGAQHPFSSIAQSRVSADSGIYRSPIEEPCARNAIVLVSDGVTEQDGEIDRQVESLPGFERATGSARCDVDPYLDADASPAPSLCADDLAEYLYEQDLASSVAGTNTVATHAIGFVLGPDAAGNAARTMLQEVATRGGGTFHEAASVAQLEAALAGVLRRILTESAWFRAPAVAVNAFNRTQNLNALYVSLFRPELHYRWQGNVKRYALDPVDGDLLDASGQRAVDPATGHFRDSARSFWSATPDGNDVAAGGAASRLPEYAQRRILTAAADGTVVDLNAAGLTDAELGIRPGDLVRPADAASGMLTAADLIAWFYGKDVADADGDTVIDETRHELGDPLHGRPATVIYGGTADAPDLHDDALFFVTNDGVLHAIDPTHPADESLGGREYWAFVPRSLVGRMRDLYYDRALADPEERGYGLDAGIAVLKLDHDDDGIVEPADEPAARDRVYLYFGARRGGSDYFAFDVTRKAAPRPLWSRSYATEGAGQSWSTPRPAHVRIGTIERLVLVFGGGYDTTQDRQPYAEDTRGRGIYIVDAITGELLWRAGPDAGATLQLTGMRHSIPGDVRVIDLTGDGLADRMYAADLGGRVWRFDIANGRPVAGPEGGRLVEGGLFASLGNVEDPDPRDSTATRRFFHAPDPALITREGTSFVNVAIGSGHRERPASDLTTQDWIFAVRDYHAYTPLLTSDYRSDCGPVTAACHGILQEEDLVDLTDVVGPEATAAVPVTTANRAAGWRVRLERRGEKALAEARTFQGKVFFTTHSPVEADAAPDGCGHGSGVNRLYVVNAVDARPARVRDESTTEPVESPDDRSRRLAQGGIAPEAVFVFPTPAADPDNPSAPRTPAPPVCLVGLESCGVGLSNAPVRTYWRQRGAR